MLRGRAGDEAEDIALDVLLAMCTKAEEMRDVRAVYFSSLNNAAIDRFRRHRVEASYATLAVNSGYGATLEALVPTCPTSRDPLEQALSKEMQVILRRWISALPANDRELVSLRIVDELTFKEIAKRTNSKLSTVHDRWNRLIQELRARLQLCDRMR